MLISIDHHSGVPVYRQLMDQVKFHIASGLLKPGDELPSTRLLSAQLGVNPMTISRSYGFLEKEQVVERRRGMRLVVRALDPGEARSSPHRQRFGKQIPRKHLAKPLSLRREAP